jgi:hypothetical protein
MPRFVILEHHWNGVHWDVMFEVDGALRTWAVDRPIEVGVELPARALADHRIAYLDYEGPVSGGRGAVRRLDRGPYRARVWEDGRVLADIRGDQLSGEVELRRNDAGVRPDPADRWTFRLLGKFA